MSINSDKLRILEAFDDELSGDGSYVSVSISKRAHEKLKNLCFIMPNDRTANLRIVSSKIIEQFFIDYKSEIQELQKRKGDIFS